MQKIELHSSTSNKNDLKSVYNDDQFVNQVKGYTDRITRFLMRSGGRKQIIIGQASVMFGLIVVLVALGWFDVTSFILGSFIGLLIIIEYTASTAVRLRWRLRLRWVILLSSLIFGAIVVRQLFILGG